MRVHDRITTREPERAIVARRRETAARAGRRSRSARRAAPRLPSGFSSTDACPLLSLLTALPRSDRTIAG